MLGSHAGFVGHHGFHAHAQEPFRAHGVVLSVGPDELCGGGMAGVEIALLHQFIRVNPLGSRNGRYGEQSKADGEMEKVKYLTLRSHASESYRENRQMQSIHSPIWERVGVVSARMICEYKWLRELAESEH